MRQASWLALAVIAGLASATAAGAQSSFSPHVAADGTISVPDDYRSWAFLGTWIVTGGDEDGGAEGLHNVYTQPDTIAHYRETGRFPDGAVLVKELLTATSGDMTTGYISWAGELEGWFVMIKDTQSRFPGHALWGDGWGWALFEVDDPTATVTENYADDCIPCHTPAEDTDWVFVHGYPVLAE